MISVVKFQFKFYINENLYQAQGFNFFFLKIVS